MPCSSKKGLTHAIPSAGDLHSAGCAPGILCHEASATSQSYAKAGNLYGSATDPGESASGAIPGIAHGSTMNTKKG
jgi:hypothetical protein